MTAITDEIRQKYKALKAQADAAYAAAEPQREALAVAEQPWKALQEEMGELTGGVDVETCDGCAEPIFPSDKRYAYEDGMTCAPCSPTYADVLDHPGTFLNLQNEPMTPAEAEAFCEAHIAGGGSLDDSLAR